MKKIKTALLTSPAFGLLAKPVFAGEEVMNISITNPGTGVESLGTLISSAFTVAIIFAILFVFAMLIMGGYGWISAGGDKAKVEEARTRITNALVGMAIIASAWVLITIIAQFFGVNFTSLSIPSAASSATEDD